MANLLKTWEGLTMQRRALLVGAVAATLVVVLMIGRLAMTPTMALLYGGLDQKNAGEVVTALEGMGVQTDVRGDSIYVPQGERDRVRLQLAQQGLPNQGQAGYELLDNLSGFGTTSEMFQAAYWRAKEGELARTISAVPGVRKARVFIGADARRPFSRGPSRATASVTVHTGGAGLTERKALSIRFLVALAVPNLQPHDVAVIDAQAGVVLKPGVERSLDLGAEAADRRAQTLRLELEELLMVRVGEGNVRVSVAIETSKETQKVSQVIVDPDSQVPVTTQSEEISDNSTGVNGAVTVASNLPEGDAAAGQQQAQTDRTETRETTSFRYSETQRDQVIEAGSVKRLGVAVLINEVAAVADDGAVSYSPRSPEELSAIEELIKSAIAYDPERGDVVTVESMRFAPVIVEDAGSEGDWMQDFLQAQGGAALQMLALGVVAALIGWFVLRPILAQQRDEDERAAAEFDALTGGGAAAALTHEQAAVIAAQSGGALTAEQVVAALGGPAGGALATIEEGGALADADAAAGYAAAAGAGQAGEEPEVDQNELYRRLDEAVDGRTAEVVALMRHWLTNPPAEGEERSEA